MDKYGEIYAHLIMTFQHLTEGERHIGADNQDEKSSAKNGRKHDLIKHSPPPSQLLLQMLVTTRRSGNLGEKTPLH